MAALLTAAAWVRARSERDLVVRSYHTSSPSRVPIVEVTSTAGPARAVAFLVHGFQCNSSMMVPLAKRLAAHGIDAYAMDLPGHGASLERFSEERAREAVAETMEAVLSARDIPPERTVLVGHSYGADVLARVAGEGHYAAMVMLGPSYRGGLTPRTPADLLVLTAEREHPHIVTFARDMIRAATGGALTAPGAVGEPGDGGARAWQVVPGADHVSLLVSGDALERTSSWLAGALGIPPSPDGPGAAPTLVFAVLALGGAVVLALALASSWPVPASAGALQPALLGAGSFGVAALAAICLTSLTIAVILGRCFDALAWLRLHEGARVASLLAIAGASMLVLGNRRVPWPSVGQVVRALPIGAVAFTIVYLAAVHAADGRLYRVSLDGIAPERHGAAVVLTAALSPFFAFTGLVLDRIRRVGGGGTRGATWAGVATVALCAGVAAALPLVDPGLGRFAAPLGAVCLFALWVGAALARAAQSPAVGAIFSSATTAWVIAVGFVRF